MIYLWKMVILQFATLNYQRLIPDESVRNAAKFRWAAKVDIPGSQGAFFSTRNHDGQTPKKDPGKLEKHG